MKGIGSVFLAAFISFVIPQDASESKPPAPSENRGSSHEIPAKYRAIMKEEPSRADVDSSRARWPYDSISIEHESGISDSPAYKATLHKDGVAEIHVGKNCELPPGDYVGAVALESYGMLCYALDKAEFQTLEARYAFDGTCYDTCSIATKSHDVRKSTSSYGWGAPIEFWMAEAVIDVVVKHVNWVPK
jgi:hypothetical protein